MDSGELRVARGGSGAEAPPLATRPGSPETPDRIEQDDFFLSSLGFEDPT